jgi:hypothetical protein
VGNVEEIARRLSKAQRAAFDGARGIIFGDGYILQYRHWRTFPGLIKKELLVAGPSQRLTPLGLAVRQHLLSSKTGE